MSLCRMRIKSDGSEAGSAGEGELLEEGVWNNFSYDFPTDPATLQPWTWAAINALQAGVDLSGEDENALCTQLYVTVTYTPGIARPLVGGSLAGNSLVGKGLAR